MGKPRSRYGQCTLFCIARKGVQQARRVITDLLREESGSALPGLGPPLTKDPQRIEHAVKFYEKGERPLEFISTRQWFVRLLDKKKSSDRAGCAYPVASVVYAVAL